MARLLFLQDIYFEYLGPAYISAMARKNGHDCALAIGRKFADFSRAVESFKPDIVGFSVMTGSHLRALELARQMKKVYGLPNIFGGPHPTLFPDFLNKDGVDMIVRGEGEHTVCEVLNTIASDRDFLNIPGLGLKLSGIPRVNDIRLLPEDLDDYPFADRELYAGFSGGIDLSARCVLTSRGCPFHCSFCFEDAMREIYKGKGSYVRARKIEKVIEECLLLRDKYGTKTIYFADDLFGMNKDWLYEFLAVYRRQVGLKFICLIRADIAASDPQYAKRLAEAGCERVFFGVETGSEPLRNKALNKQLTDGEIYKAARFLHEAGIKFRSYNILGLPGETLADALKTVRMNIDIKADYPWCSLFSPIPGLALTDYAVKTGCLSGKFGVDDVNRGFFLDNPLTSKEIRNLQKFFQTAVRMPWTLALIRLLIKLPPNPLFTVWFGFMYFINYLQSEKKRFFPALMTAAKNWRYILTKN